MKKVLLILIFFISLNMFSQSSTEKWNSYTKRYEYFDRYGNMTAYKLYNTYLQQWETYSINNSTNSSYEKNQPVSSFNLELIDKTLGTLQDRYDNNYNEVVNYSNNLKSQIRSKLEYSNSDYKDIKFVNMIVERFNNETLIPIWRKGYDYSKNSLKVDVKNAMLNGLNKLLSETVCCPPNYKYTVNKEAEINYNSKTDKFEVYNINGNINFYNGDSKIFSKLTSGEVIEISHCKGDRCFVYRVSTGQSGYIDKTNIRIKEK